MKKLFALLPIIGLVIGTFAIATEIHKPTPLETKSISVPVCNTKKPLTPSLLASSLSDAPVLCAE